MFHTEGDSRIYIEQSIQVFYITCSAMSGRENLSAVRVTLHVVLDVLTRETTFTSSQCCEQMVCNLYN